MLFTWVTLNVSYSVEERQEEEEEEEKNPPGRMHSGWKRSTSDKPVNMHERWSDPSCVPSEMELPRVWSSPILAASAYSSPAAQPGDPVDTALSVALSIAGTFPAECVHCPFGLMCLRKRTVPCPRDIFPHGLGFPPKSLLRGGRRRTKCLLCPSASPEF